MKSLIPLSLCMKEYLLRNLCIKKMLSNSKHRYVTKMNDD